MFALWYFILLQMVLLSEASANENGAGVIQQLVADVKDLKATNVNLVNTVESLQVVPCENEVPQALKVLYTITFTFLM